MKLRNKLTGEIADFKVHKYIGSDDGNPVYAPFNDSIEQWEDAPEEPDEYWYLSCAGVAMVANSYNWEREKEIGNLFETKEEAEKAVEKLKAWKRLKDKGFRFTGFDVANRGGDNVICGQVYFKAGTYDREEIKSDLDICFGGEE